MQPGDIQKIYQELMENKSIQLPEELSDYDVQVFLQLIAFRMKKERQLYFLQHEGHKVWII